MRALVLTLALLAPVVPLSAAPGATAAAPTCAGREATIVGSGEGRVTGTPRADVIVTGGAREVRSGAGDDVICVTGPTSRVYAEDGDDQVLGAGHVGPKGLEVDLGEGADSFVGGSGNDVVDSGDGAFYNGSDNAVDVIRTGAGDDEVRSGTYLLELVDDIDLGAGDDALILAGREVGRGARLAGGSGSDLLQLDTYFSDDVRADEPQPDDNLEWVFSNTDPDTGGHADAGGVRKLSWTGFERFVLVANAAAYAFVGGPASESVEAGGLRYALMGPGDDEVEAYGPLVGRLDGGPGRDRFAAPYCAGRVTADLRTDTYRCVRGRRVATVRLTGIEDLSVVADRARVKGTAAADRISVQACRATVLGGAGPDVLRVVGRDFYFVRGRGACGGRQPVPGLVELRGGPGDDVLRGARQDDVLLGGAGFDRAFGRGGSDVCRAERRVGCER